MEFNFKDSDLVRTIDEVTLPSPVGTYILDYHGKPFFSLISGATVYSTFRYDRGSLNWDGQILVYERPSRLLAQNLRRWVNDLHPDAREAVRKEWQERLRALCGIPRNQQVRLEFHTNLLNRGKPKKTKGVWKLFVYYWPPKNIELQPVPKPATYFGPMAATIRSAFIKFENEIKADQK